MAVRRTVYVQMESAAISAWMETSYGDDTKMLSHAFVAAIVKINTLNSKPFKFIGFSLNQKRQAHKRKRRKTTTTSSKREIFKILTKKKKKKIVKEKMKKTLNWAKDTARSSMKRKRKKKTTNNNSINDIIRRRRCSLTQHSSKGAVVDVFFFFFVSSSLSCVFKCSSWRSPIKGIFTDTRYWSRVANESVSNRTKFQNETKHN